MPCCMSEAIWVAIIGLVGVVVAVINGVFGLIKKPEKDSKKKSEDKISVNQTVSGNNNTVIGVQTDKREKS